MGMADKMSADHPFIIEIAPEGISHPSMNPAKPHSGMHGAAQAGALLVGKLPAGPAGRDDVESPEPVRIGKAFQAGDRFRFAAAIDQRGAEFMDEMFRLMAIPTALKKQYLCRFHFQRHDL
jgi:hypothetical protein